MPKEEMKILKLSYFVVYDPGIKVKIAPTVDSLNLRL